MELKHSQERATARQARYLESLDAKLSRAAADRAYHEVVGIDRLQLPPGNRYSILKRGVASRLIEAYRNEVAMARQERQP